MNDKSSFRDIFLFSVCIAALSILLAACAGALGSDEPEGYIEMANPDYNRDTNILVHKGWKISAPPDWTFHAPVYAADKGEVFRMGSPGDVTLSLHRLEFGFNIDFEKLLTYFGDELSNKYKVINSGVVEPPLITKSRKPAWYWNTENEKGVGTIILEGEGQLFHEWRMQQPWNVDPVFETVLEAIFMEAQPSDPSSSIRTRPSGFIFSSQGGPWRWASDLGDGFLLELLVAPGDDEFLVGVFSRESLKDAESWWSEELERTEQTVSIELTLQGIPIRSEALVSVKNRLLHAVIPIPDDGVYPACDLIISVETKRDEVHEIRTVLKQEKLINLLQFNIIRPVNP